MFAVVQFDRLDDALQVLDAALVYRLLGGELSLRFVLKVLVVGVIAGGVFGYYLGELRREEREG